MPGFRSGISVLKIIIIIGRMTVGDKLIFNVEYLIEKIVPAGVQSFNQINFPFARIILDPLFTLDGQDDIGMCFKPHQLLQSMLARETRCDVVFMFINPLRQVRCYTRVNYPTRSVGHHVDPGLTHAFVFLMGDSGHEARNDGVGLEGIITPIIIPSTVMPGFMPGIHATCRLLIISTETYCAGRGGRGRAV